MEENTTTELEEDKPELTSETLSFTEPTTNIPTTEIEANLTTDPDETTTDFAELELLTTTPPAKLELDLSTTTKPPNIILKSPIIPEIYDDNSVQIYDNADEYKDDGGKEVLDSNEVGSDIKESTTNKSFEVVTMKPAKSMKDDNFKEFMDSTDIDNIDETHLTTNSNEASEVDVHVANIDGVDNQQKKKDKIVSVVSVVTTKSVVNNTVIGKV